MQTSQELLPVNLPTVCKTYICTVFVFEGKPRLGYLREKYNYQASYSDRGPSPGHLPYISHCTKVRKERG